MLSCWFGFDNYCTLSGLLLIHCPLARQWQTSNQYSCLGKTSLPSHLELALNCRSHHIPERESVHEHHRYVQKGADLLLSSPLKKKRWQWKLSIYNKVYESNVYWIDIYFGQTGEKYDLLKCYFNTFCLTIFTNSSLGSWWNILLSQYSYKKKNTWFCFNVFYWLTDVCFSC